MRPSLRKSLPSRPAAKARAVHNRSLCAAHAGNAYGIFLLVAQRLRKSRRRVLIDRAAALCWIDVPDVPPKNSRTLWPRFGKHLTGIGDHIDSRRSDYQARAVAADFSKHADNATRQVFDFAQQAKYSLADQRGLRRRFQSTVQPAAMAGASGPSVSLARPLSPPCRCDQTSRK